MKLPHKIGLFFVLFVMSSCVKDVNFSQIDDLYAHTPLTLPLFSLELSQQQFMDENNNIVSFIQDSSQIRISDFMSHSANSQCTIDMNIDNFINYSFMIELRFQDAQGNTLFTKVIPVQADVVNQEHAILLADTDFSNFLLTDKIQMRVMVNYGSSNIYPSDIWLQVKSSINLDYVY